MNCTKFTPPFPIYVNFYYYYSYLTLLLTLAFTPILFYVILTQSKNLKNFKWLILNHSIWCLLFEIIFTTIKPLFLSPAIGGYPLGIIRNGNLKLTAFTTYAVLIILFINCTALGATVLCRYLLVFPATKWYNKKRGISLAVFLLSIGFTNVSVMFYPFLFFDDSEFYKMAIEYDPCLRYYFKEPGFLFISHELSAKTLYIGFGLLIGVLITGICLAGYFIYLVKTNLTVTTTTKLSTSLLMSAIVQLSITIIFGLIPITAFIGILAFEIPNTENLMILVFSFMSTHSFLECLTTLYFVTPYRKRIIEIFQQFLCCKIFPKNHGQVSVVSNVVMLNINFSVNK